MIRLGIRQITHTALGLGLVLVLPSAVAPVSVDQAGVFAVAPASNNYPENALERFLSEPSSDTLRQEGSLSSQAKRAPQAQKDTIRRYSNSGRVLILGGPEAFSM